jgi:N6-adenosine-specific RNA methylase IME4
MTILDIPFPDKTFKLIYADPAWRYDSVKIGGSMKSGASQKYPTMTLTEICNLPVSKISDPKGSVLFLWVTTPLKYEIATSGLLESWKFDYKTTVYWRKLMSQGMGYWFRGQVEECWLCTRGKVKPFGLQIPNFIQTQIEDHSKKPKLMRQIAYDVSEKFDLKPRIELFSRDRHEGWTVWGNEVPRNEQKVLKEEYPDS